MVKKLEIADQQFGRLTATRVREVFDYSPDTGVLTYKISRSRSPGGKAANARAVNGYVVVRLDGRLHGGHRIAWVHAHGELPSGEIDHINGDRADNRLSNLRDVSRAINNQNRRGPGTLSSSGFLGVSRFRDKWRAIIRVDGKKNYLGTFDTPQMAYEVYLEAKRRLHPGCEI